MNQSILSFINYFNNLIKEYYEEIVYPHLKVD